MNVEFITGMAGLLVPKYQAPTCETERGKALAGPGSYLNGWHIAADV